MAKIHWSGWLLLILTLGAWNLAGARYSDTEKAVVVSVTRLTPAGPNRRPGAAVQLRATLAIAPHWHTNSHRPTLAWLIPTTAAFTLPEGWQVQQIRYPEGSLQSFRFAKDLVLSVYSGEVPVTVALQPPPGQVADRLALSVHIRYQACNDRVCLPPALAEGTFTVPLEPSALTP